MELHELLPRVADTTGRAVDAVGPDELGLPTPCTEWDVRAVVHHLIQGARVFGAAARGEHIDPAELAPDAADDADLGGVYRAAAGASVEAFARPEVLGETLQLPFGPMPGRVAMSILCIDHLVHGWDVAVATGQDPAIDPAVAEAALELARATITDAFRGPGKPIGFATPCEEEAPPHERLAAFLGRELGFRAAAAG